MSYCDAEGPDRFQMRWYRTDGGKISHKIEIKDLSKNKGPFKLRAYIFFKNLTDADVGYYVCEANNTADRARRRVRLRLQS